MIQDITLRLLKQRGDWSAGTYFKRENGNWYVQPRHERSWVRVDDDIEQVISVMLDEGLWLQVVRARLPHRWRQEERKVYWYVESEGGPEKSVDMNDSVDDERYMSGNYFKTKRQAQAAAEAMQALLEFLHTPQGQLTGAEMLDYTAKIKAARQAVVGIAI